MNSNNKVGIAIGALLGLLGGGYVAVSAYMDHEYRWAIPGAIFFIAVLASAYELYKGNVAGLFLSRILAIIAFGFGVYIFHFRWTFWLFRNPPLSERIMAILQPIVLLPLTLSILWLAYTTHLNKSIK